MRRAVSSTLIALSFVTLALPALVPTASALPTSSSVVFIGGETSMNGGGLFHSDPAFAGMAFAILAPGAVTPAALAAYDTVVVNTASAAMACTTSTLSAASQSAIVGFAAAGGKVIMYDSECTPSVSYTWLPYPFTTTNPGASGSVGGLVDVEQNTLSCSPTASPCYVDVNKIATTTDAAGDSNVVVTNDPHWCADLQATNVQGSVGYDHMYAETPAGGLYIYNGFDVDTLSTTPLGTAGGDYVAKVWLLELLQKWNPSGLPCSHTVVEDKPAWANCEAFGVRVLERDLTSAQALGNLDVNLSHSAANTTAVPGAWPATYPGPYAHPEIPPSPGAHADAQQAGFQYYNPAAQLSVSTRAVHSQCDVLAHRDPKAGAFTWAYGRGGIQDLTINKGGVDLLHTELLDYELNAIGTPASTWPGDACELVEVAPTTACTAPWTTPIRLGTPGVWGMTVTFYEQWGANPGGAVDHSAYGGDAVHICIQIEQVTRIDVYIGLVTVGVTGGQPLSFPPAPDEPCDGNVGCQTGVVFNGTGIAHGIGAPVGPGLPCDPCTLLDQSQQQPPPCGPTPCTDPAQPCVDPCKGALARLPPCKHVCTKITCLPDPCATINTNLPPCGPTPCVDQSCVVDPCTFVTTNLPPCGPVPPVRPICITGNKFVNGVCIDAGTILS